SSLDTEWSGAVARNATINFVYSLDVLDSAQYVIDNAVAPVLSMSYGMGCEMYDLIDLPSERQMVLQANAEGITWVNAAADSGATDCDDYGDTVAEGGLAVDVPAAFPEITAMGGTAVSNASTYWNTGNTATFQSAKGGYIPETVWNDTAVSVANGGAIEAGG